MKKRSFLLLALFMFIAQNCFAEVMTHKSTFGNYLKMQSEKVYKLKNPDDTVTIMINRDASFSKNNKTDKPVIIESNIFSISLQLKTNQTEKDKKESKAGNLFFSKANLPFFFIDKKIIPFKEVFDVVKVDDKNIRGTFNKRTKKLLGQAQNVALFFEKNETRYRLDISKEDLLEWQQILALDMAEEYQKAFFDSKEKNKPL